MEFFYTNIGIIAGAAIGLAFFQVTPRFPDVFVLFCWIVSFGPSGPQCRAVVCRKGRESNGPGRNGLRLAKTSWLLEVAYQCGKQLGSISPVSDGHQLLGVARDTPHTRWTTLTRPALHEGVGDMDVGDTRMVMIGS